MSKHHVGQSHKRFTKLLDSSCTDGKHSSSDRTTHKIFKQLQQIFANDDSKDKTVLLIAESERLCDITGLEASKVVKINYPDFTAEKMDFSSERFDFVITENLLEFATNIHAAAHELMRVLKYGGQFVHVTSLIEKQSPYSKEHWKLSAEAIKSLFNPYCENFEVTFFENKKTNSASEDEFVTMWCHGTRNSLHLEHVLPFSPSVLEKRTHYKTHKGPFKLAILACTKNEAPFLLEWIAYHRVVGIEHFYLYDNESDDATFHILNKLSQAGIVSATFWHSPEKTGKQLPAYAHWLKNFRNTVEEIAVIDVDEFIVPIEHDSIQDALKDYSKFSGVAIHWKCFGSDNQKLRDQNLVIDRFVKTHNFNGDHGKCISKVKDLTKIGVHFSDFRIGHCVFMDKIPQLILGDRKMDRSPDGPMQINHYFCKSFEEFELKRMRGRGTQYRGSVDEFRPVEIFYQIDSNIIYDNTILRFRDKLVEELGRLRNFM